MPGTVRGLGLAHAKWGKAPWADLVRPAAKLARDGFRSRETLARSLNGQLFPRQNQEPGAVPEDLGPRATGSPTSPPRSPPSGSPTAPAGKRATSSSSATSPTPSTGSPPKGPTSSTPARPPEDRRPHGEARRPDHARRPRRLPGQGPPADPRDYKGFDVYGMGPPASGGILIVQMLNILERYDLKADGPHSPRTLHRVTEAMRRGFYTRATAIADPDFVEVPVERLISKSYADELARSITDKATPSASLAPFPILDARRSAHDAPLDPRRPGERGRADLYPGGGIREQVGRRRRGVLAEQRDGRLQPDPRPDRDDRPDRDAAEPDRPRKRMLSSQSPTIVLKDGKVRLVTGSPGGRTIPNTTLWVVLNVLEFGLTPREAVDAPRTHHPWFPDVLNLEGQSWSAADSRSPRPRWATSCGSAASRAMPTRSSSTPTGRSTASPTAGGRRPGRPGIDGAREVDHRSTVSEWSELRRARALASPTEVGYILQITSPSGRIVNLGITTILSRIT